MYHSASRRLLVWDISGTYPEPQYKHDQCNHSVNEGMYLQYRKGQVGKFPSYGLYEKPANLKIDETFGQEVGCGLALYIQL